MKKLFIIAAFVAAFFVTEKAQAQLNINVGYAPELMITKTPTHDTTLFFHGLSFGLNWDFNLSNNLNLTTGIQYRMNMRDHSEHVYQGSYFVHHVTRDQQKLIDLPILVKYKMALGSSVTLSPFVGPMFSWGINGKTTDQWLYPIDTETHYEWYGDDGYMNRFNVYGMAGFEVGFKRFAISIGGRYGFLDLNKRNTGTTTKVYGFFANFGYTF